MNEMKAEILRDKLVWGANLASKIINSRSNIPVLSNILITASENNYLQIESSNLEISLRLQLPAKIEKPGQTTVPGRKFAEYLSSLNEDKIKLRMEKNVLKVEGDQNETSFITMAASDFPELPTNENATNANATNGNDKTQVVVNTSDFKKLVKKTVFASASQGDQPVLTGVMLDFNLEKSQLIAAASDSFRLSVVNFPVELNLSSKVVVPASTLSEVASLISDSDSSEDKAKIVIGLSQGENQIFFKVADVEVISRLLEVNFPDYDKLIQHDYDHFGTFERVPFLDALKTTSIFASREGQLVKMNFLSDQSKLEMTAQSSEIGQHRGQISGEIKGEPIELGFNSRYVMEALNSFETSKIKISSVDVKKPVLFESVDGEDSYLHVVMPMDLESSRY